MLRLVLRRSALALALLAAPAGAQTVPLALVAASDGAPDDDFGYDLAVDGDWAVVGAHGNERDGSRSGAAYVFERTADGWVERQKLVSPGESYGGFGTSVDLSGDRLVVGDPVGFYTPGFAYIYVRSGHVWTLEAALTGDRPGGSDNHDFFGAAVALDGDRALVGASQESGGGAAYVFRRDPSGWVREATFGSAAGPGLNIGWAVALDGGRAAVGGRRQVGIYARTGDTWTEDAAFSYEDGIPEESFGQQVALSGDLLLVSAWVFHDTDGEGNPGDPGAVYVYRHDGSMWASDSRIQPADSVPNDDFGRAVALAPDGIALITALRHEAGPETVYVFAEGATGWVETSRLTAPQSGSEFGLGLAFDGDRALVGAPLADTDGTARTGAVYAYPALVVAADGSPDETAWLSAVRPNPARGIARVTLSLDAPRALRATLHDVLGRELAVLLDGGVAGETPLTLDTAGLAPGVYVVRVEGGGLSASRRLTVVR